MEVYRPHRPHGKALATWEANILKIRAFEMVLILFYMEDLRTFIIESIQASDKWYGQDSLSSGKPKTKEGKKFELARAVLVSDGIISQEESNELKTLVDYRNLIGHQIHDLTVDVGIYADLTRHDPLTFELIPLYDYSAAKRASMLRKKIQKGMGQKFYVMAISCNFLFFQSAEKTYLTEIERLKQKVNKGINKANKVRRDIKNIIDSIPRSVIELAQPTHSKNIKKNGTLSKCGMNCAFRLFDAKANPLAVSYLMRISYRSAKHWFIKWKVSKELG